MIGNLAVVLMVTALAPTPCANVKSLSLPNTTITMAELMPAGDFRPPNQAGGGAGARSTFPSSPRRGGCEDEVRADGVVSSGKSSGLNIPPV
jgi:hypothetical protein